MSWINQLLGRNTIDDVLADAREKKQTELKVKTQVEGEDITTEIDKCCDNQKIEYKFYVSVSVNGNEYKMDEFEWTCQSKYKDNYASIKKFKLRNYENAVEKAERLSKEGLKVTINTHSIEDAKRYIAELKEELEKRMKECY